LPPSRQTGTSMWDSKLLSIIHKIAFAERFQPGYGYSGSNHELR
jgi:hypothetical protein